MALTLTELLAGLRPGGAPPLEGPAPTAVSADSRQVGPGTVFVAVKGTRSDGHAHVAEAAARGAVALVVQAGAVFAGPPSGSPAPVITVADTRPVPALLARRLNGAPDRNLVTVGVTGTNGKTTVAFLLRHLLERLHGPCGLMGTIRYQAGDKFEPAPLTTPAGPVLYHWLGSMVAEGCRSAAMEVSSHALDQGRVAGLELDAAVLTNLSRDHLDYHESMAAYLQAKARILDLLRPGGAGPLGRPGVAVVNVGDRALAGLDLPGGRTVRFCCEPGLAPAADLAVIGVELGLQGTRLSCRWRERTLELSSSLVGRYNVENLTAGLATALALGFTADEAIAALATAPQVPGRMERFDLPAGGIAVVDYAHTPDALAAVLATCGELAPGRVLAVFGCGGDRDRGKRPLMGRAAADGADEIWVTADNPRSEDPLAIQAEILAGIETAPSPRAAAWHAVPDRTEAVGAALAASRRGDVVVIAGKGHENYQLVGDRVLDLDDRSIVRKWIAQEGSHA